MTISIGANPPPNFIGGDPRTDTETTRIRNTETVSPGQLNETNQVSKFKGSEDAPEVEPNMPQLPPPETGSDLGEVTSKMLQSSGGINMTELFSELVDIGRTLKQVSKTDREVRLNQVETDARKAADDMRSSAWCSLAATLVTSGAQIGGGALSLSGAVASQKAFDAKFAEMKDTSPMMASDMARQAAQTVQAPYQFGATLTGEGGKILGTVPQIVGQYLEASKADHQSKSAREQTKADNENDYKQAAEKLISSVIDKMSEIQRAQSQAMSSIARMG